MYYIIYDDYVLVFVLAISDKKDQQKVINTIKNLIPYYRAILKKLKMDKWRCSVCNYVVESEDLPAKCPECNGGSHKFKPLFRLANKRRILEHGD